MTEIMSDRMDVMNVNWNVILAVNNARKEYVVALSRVGIY